MFLPKLVLVGEFYIVLLVVVFLPPASLGMGVLHCPFGGSVPAPANLGRGVLHCPFGGSVPASS